MKMRVSNRNSRANGQANREGRAAYSNVHQLYKGYIPVSFVPNHVFPILTLTDLQRAGEGREYNQRHHKNVPSKFRR